MHNIYIYKKETLRAYFSMIIVFILSVKAHRFCFAAYQWKTSVWKQLLYNFDLEHYDWL